MNSRYNLRMAAAVLVISLAPSAFADQLTPNLTSVLPRSLGASSAAPPSASVSISNGMIVLDIANSYWTNGQISASWKVPGQPGNDPAQLKAVVQNNDVSLAGGNKGSKKIKPPSSGGTVRVPETSAFVFLGLHLAALLSLGVVFRKRIVLLR